MPWDEQGHVIKFLNVGNENADGGDLPLLLPQYKAGDWVKIKRSQYRGDLGRIRSLSSDNDRLVVAVVPRIGVNVKGSRVRTDPALFDFRKIRDAFPFERIDKPSEDVYLFKRRTYKNGLCELPLPGLHFVVEAKPTICDLGGFALTETDFGELDRGEPFLRRGDRVRIVSGSQASWQGIVSDIKPDNILIHNITDAFELPLSPSIGEDIVNGLHVHINDVQRVLKLGDHVRARVGPSTGTEGIVTSIDDEWVSLQPVGTATVVRFDILLLILLLYLYSSYIYKIATRAKWVETYEPDFRMEDDHGLPGPSDRPFQPRDVYQGLRVLVRKQKRFKGSYGYVHSSDHVNKTCQVARDGVNDKTLHTIEMRFLISL